MLGNNRETYLKIEQLSANLGFVAFGCAKAQQVPLSEQNHYLEAMDNGYFAQMGYLKRNLEKRFNPVLLVEGAKSVMVFLAPYSLPEGSAPPKGVAQFALGRDYHTVIKERLYKIMDYLAEEFPNFSGRAFTDSAPVMERVWGVKCGLGFIGKNNFLISRECGIKNFIATIICNTEIPPTLELFPERVKNMESGCAECTNCIKSCPGGALCRAFEMDAGKCISYHTIENRELPQRVAVGDLPPFGDTYFGCDACLDACPWNKKNRPGWSDFHINVPLLGEITPQRWRDMDECEFQKLFDGSPLLRGGLKNINAALEWGEKCGNNE